ncbi:class I SAM-dependent methyltransferase [Pseudonocardia lacus]|uniref:class I SAM-dependent methyltransferase n=1 Tax=Pseudonocardia lacus TaxID=2835865 RepID=UPI001BDD7B14|nr:class I SAM-dependent methyltransferase [Pseudonocardia lacus]
MAGAFDPQYMAAFFDDYGDQEWTRHDTPHGRASVAVHVDLLAEYVRPGDLVLDAGAGPGRLTVELARLGARVHVGDLSPGQLEANRRRVGEAGREDAVVAREVLDICDLGHLPDASFDVVVCVGGPLSYVRDRADDALAELVRVTRPGGHVLVGVMSTVGTLRAFLPGVVEERRRHGAAYVEGVMASGDLDREPNGQEMHMFRWAELERLCAAHGEVVAGAAANFLTANPDPDFYAGLTDDEWEVLLAWERRLCREPGVRDGGTHMVAVVRRPAAGS